jgi:hypothetical protein
MQNRSGRVSESCESMAGGEIGQRSPTSLVDTGDDLPKLLNNVGVADLVKHPPEFPALGPGVPPAPSPSAKPPVEAARMAV